MMLSNVCDELNVNLPAAIPRIFRTDRFDYLQALLGEEDLTRTYSMRTIKLACDGIRFAVQRDMTELRDLAKECAKKRVNLSKMGKNTKFSNMCRDEFDIIESSQIRNWSSY
jgi:hypothetical protein